MDTTTLRNSARTSPRTDDVEHRHCWAPLIVATAGVFAFIAASDAEACTTILVGKSATADGSVLLAHNEDMGLEAAGRLWTTPARNFKKRGHIKVPYVSVTRPDETYAYWASGNPEQSSGLGVGAQHRAYDSVLVGMNQWGVAMACNWAHSKEQATPKKGIRRYAIRQMILERSKTARDAADLVGHLIDEYGQADWGGLIYNIADVNEAWVVETTTQHWVARRVPDDAVYAVANRFTIGSDFDMASDDLVQFAQTRGWYDPRHGAFSFRDAYGLPAKMHQAYDSEREARIHQLIAGKRGTLLPTDIFVVLRDRYEGTDKHTRPQQKPVWREDLDKDPSLFRTISTNLCQSSSVAHLRGNLPVEVGAVMWYAMANPSYSDYFPLYAGADRVPNLYGWNDSKRSPDSGWWVFKDLQLEGDRFYDAFLPLVKKTRAAEHAKVSKQQKSVEKQALAFFHEGNRQAGVELLRSFTFARAKAALDRAHNLREISVPSSTLRRSPRQTQPRSLEDTK